MPEAPFRVILAPTARGDLYQILEFWLEQGEVWRGEKIFRDLGALAERELSDRAPARRGRPVRSRMPDAREILAFGVCRIIYRIDETSGIVNILRFWHAHRDELRDDA